MARKGNQQKNGWDRNLSNHKKGVSDLGALPNTRGRGKVSQGKVGGEEELPNGNQPNTPITESANKTDYVGIENKSKQKSKKSQRKENQGMGAMDCAEQPVHCEGNPGDCIEDVATIEAAANGRPANSTPCGSKYSKSSSRHMPNGMHTDDTMGTLEDTLVFMHLRASAVNILKAVTECLQRQRPLVISLTNKVSNAACYVTKKIENAYPIVLRWLMHFGNIMLLLFMVWLDCTLRGIESFLRMGTTSFFTVIWCSILSIIAMLGIFKFALVLVVMAFMGLLLGFTVAILLTAVSGIIFLWFCGSFWTTALVICSGGLTFMLSHERIALLITTSYSVYCSQTYVGWFGLILAFNLSFISSDALIFFLKNSINERRRPPQATEQTAGMQGQPGFFYSEPKPSSADIGSGPSSDRSPGIPSTSGTDFEITSEDEVVRLLNCTDHYSALGLSRYENIDVSILKREYRKKAMLVHPDKNMGNEKAAEAFKKLQNAYEVLLDSLKRKAYDDELKREELLNYFRRFQDASQKNGSHKFFGTGFARMDADGEDPFGESRRIDCRKCGNFHVWIQTKKSKSTARWCQDCRDSHQAKDGDGWVEQSSQPFFFGILQKVNAPRAYVCADSKIYDATEWYICQGLRIPVNTHKPSFHVNTSLTPKHNNGKGAASSGQRGGTVPSSSNPEENMTEEEFFEWLQNAVQAGIFDNFSGGTSSESPSSRTGNFSKSGGSNSASCSGSKRKKKGKKQW
ncbi:chaperone DnaJ-domain superfamily protein [Actinidia rufa]|uniref:Chaperone DnaJ-domain superfamily protein n=1 Tax=Actinidia rufa TaxID=165716 RepID=A0A7J0DH54_9ERIC|nr:chaperone DnaJ-domain superfamily protein [Actinidia rufa]